MDERLMELEIKAAYQEELLQALNDVVGQQQQQISRLEATCRLLHERIKGLSENAGRELGDTAAHEVPPHY